MRRGIQIGSQAKIDSKTIIETILKHQIPLNSSQDLDRLVQQVGDSKYVLLGEATHGTSEFYRWRATITRRLIEEKGFKFVAVEGDWPDCFEANKFIKSRDSGKKPVNEILADSFKRWPTWMWANWEITELLEWMKMYNQNLPSEKQTGFYGLDVYSLYESIGSVMKFVKDLGDPESYEAAMSVFRCFEPYAKDPVRYGKAVKTKKFSEGCKKEVLKLLSNMKKKYELALSKTVDPKQKEDIFAAQMNSKVLVDAENYYKIMLTSSNESWNVRDDHMADTLDSLMDFHGKDAKCIVWAHNTHVGDARYTDMADSGERNIGQIVRERHGNDGVFIVGFGTNEGTVIAGEEWDAPWQEMHAPSAPYNSWEFLLREANGKNIPNKMLIFPQIDERKVFDDVRGHRAIGVVYNPETDRYGHWVPTVLGRRYDAFIYLDKTMALNPLPDEPDLTLQPPETYPWGSLI
jgi:erythromycin esterase-like protein